MIDARITVASIGLAGAVCVYVVLTWGSDADEDGTDEDGPDGDAAGSGRSPLLGRIRAFLSLERVLATAFALAGIAALVVAVVVLRAPSLAREIGLRPLEVTPWEWQRLTVTFVAAAFLCGIALFGLWRVLGLQEESDVRRVEPPFDRAPEAVPDDERESPGAPFAGTLEALAGTTPADARVTPVRNELAATAQSVLVHYGDHDATEAERLIESGNWTEDIRAAGFLSEDPAVGPDWVTELRDWVSGETRARRRVRHTITAIEHHVERADGDDR